MGSTALMPEVLRPTRSERTMTRAIEDGLARVELGSEPALGWLRAMLGRLLTLRLPQAHGFEDVDGTVRVAFVHTEVGDELQRDMDASLAVRGTEGWSHFDLLAPEPGHCNRAVGLRVETLRGRGCH